MWSLNFKKQEKPVPVETAPDTAFGAVQAQLQLALRQELKRQGYPDHAARDVEVTVARNSSGPGLVMDITAPYMGESWNCDIGDGTFRDAMSALRDAGGKFQVKRTAKKESDLVQDAEGDWRIPDGATYHYTFSGFRLGDFIATMNRMSPQAQIDTDALLGKSVAG